MSQSLPKRSSPVTAIAHIENRWKKPAKCSERRQSERTMPLQLIELPNIPRSSAGMRKLQLHHHHWPARFWFAQLWLHAFGHNFAFSRFHFFDSVREKNLLFYIKIPSGSRIYRRVSIIVTRCVTSPKKLDFRSSCYFRHRHVIACLLNWIDGMTFKFELSTELERAPTTRKG